VVAAAIVLYGARRFSTAAPAPSAAVHFSAPAALSDLRDAIQDLVAARLTGGQAVQGHVAGTPERLLVEARLGQARARIQGNADSLSYLTDRLVLQLLAIQAARDSDELAAFHATSLQALRAYLAGRDAYRRGKLGVRSEATEHFERALFLDSTFALAGLRLAEIAVRFGMAERDERWKLDAIWRQRSRLGAADRALLEAYLGPQYPKPATLAELIAVAQRATVIAPHRSEAWHIAGASFLRFGPRVGYPHWHERATDALQRAVALDSSEVFPIQYLVLLAALAGDRAAVWRYGELHRAHDATGGQQSDFIQWAVAIVSGDHASLANLRERMPRMTSVSLQSIVEWSESLGLGLDDGDRAARALDQTAVGAAQRRAVIVRVVPFLLNRGRPREASQLLATAERGFGQAADVGVLEFRIYAALYWDADSTEAAAAAQTLEAYLGGASVPFGYVRDRATAACALAHWRIATGDFTQAEKLLTVQEPSSVESLPLCRTAAQARLAAARRRPSATAALERLDALLSAGSDIREFFPTVAAVIASRLYEGRGDLEHALDLARRRTFWWNWLLSTPLRDEARLAALTGDTTEAISAYRQYLALRSDPEPRLRPDIERVRALMPALEFGTRGHVEIVPAGAAGTIRFHVQRGAVERE
jgi:hypothetical protein